MNIYSHLVIADELKPYIQPDNDQDYYWGAIIPDVRNLTGMRRCQTHLSAKQILNDMGQYPAVSVQLGKTGYCFSPKNARLFAKSASIRAISAIRTIKTSSFTRKTFKNTDSSLPTERVHPALKSFLQGYLVHCMTDQLDLVSILNKQFPFFLFKRKLTSQHYPMILELFYLEQKIHVTYTVSGRHNPMLDVLGITPEQSQMYYQLISKYLANPSFEAAIMLIQNLGNISNQRIDHYLASARKFQANQVLKSLMFLGIRIAKIHTRIVEEILSAISQSKSKNDQYIT
jgi:hypothetical protein